MKNRQFLFVITVFVLCSACSNGSKKETASVATIAVIQEDYTLCFAENEVMENKAIEVEQNESSIIDTYLITDSCAGPFKIDTDIPKKIEGFIVTKSLEEKNIADRGST